METGGSPIIFLSRRHRANILHVGRRFLQIVSIIGNRPEFIKAAALSKGLAEAHHERIIHTGQHYDDELSRVFFEELSVPAPARQLRIHSGSNASQIGRMLESLAVELQTLTSDVVIVYGDTNSTLAGALAAAHSGVPIGHVEAGMRSFDRSMPEELNRIVVDHLSTFQFCSTAAAVSNLRDEGIVNNVHLVGDVNADVLLAFKDVARGHSRALEHYRLTPGKYVLVTVHRSGNVDDPLRLLQVVDLLEAVAVTRTIVFPLHPRTFRRLSELGVQDRLATNDNIILTPPVGYFDFLELLRNASAVMTDSGGVQKEACLLETPCLTLRGTTEWVETVESGWNVLIDFDIPAALKALERTPPRKPAPDLYGGGQAASRISQILTEYESVGNGQRP